MEQNCMVGLLRQVNLKSQEQSSSIIKMLRVSLLIMQDIGYRVKFFREYIMNTESNIVIFGYRGYSYSEGKPSEKGIK